MTNAKTAPTDSIVHLVDEDRHARQHLERVLRSAYLTCRQYPDATDLLWRLRDDRPGCVLLAMRRPGQAGLRTQQSLSEAGFTLPLIFLSSAPRVSAAVRAMRAGAEDFLATPVDDDTLVETLYRAIARDRRRKARQHTRQRLSERLATLTPRERQTLEAVVAGLSNKRIAEHLSISPKTVELHRAHMMQKMQADSVAEVVKLYLYATDPPAHTPRGFPWVGTGDPLIGNPRHKD